MEFREAFLEEMREKNSSFVKKVNKEHFLKYNIL